MTKPTEPVKTPPTHAPCRHYRRVLGGVSRGGYNQYETFFTAPSRARSFATNSSIGLSPFTRLQFHRAIESFHNNPATFAFGDNMVNFKIHRSQIVSRTPLHAPFLRLNNRSFIDTEGFSILISVRCGILSV